MFVKLLTEHHLEFLSLKGGCIGSSESTHVKMPYCWKSHVTAHFAACMTKCKLLMIRLIIAYFGMLRIQQIAPFLHFFQGSMPSDPPSTSFYLHPYRTIIALSLSN